MKSQNSQGAMHLKKEEWDIIIQNTNACFNDFTFRLKEAYPQLSHVLHPKSFVSNFWGAVQKLGSLFFLSKPVFKKQPKF